MELLLYVITAIWVAEYMYWLAVAVSFNFYSLAITFNSELGALVNCTISGLLLLLETKPKKKISHLDHHWPFHKNLFSNHTKMKY